MALSFVAIFMLLILVAALVALVVGIVLLVKSGKQAAEGGGCGACGYTVRGVSTFSCPECGADLREVGIQSTGKSSKAAGFTLTLIGAAVLGLILVCGGFFTFARMSKTTRGVTPAMPAPPVQISPSEESPPDTVDSVEPE